jgi:ABC-2 type transport system permease protein
MKFWEIFRFEVGYQLRRPLTWIYFAALFALCLKIATDAYTENARDDGYAFNGTFVIASLTLLGSMMALLVIASFASDAGARDAQTRMHPLVYTLPVGKAAYLSGRFLAAFALSAIILAAVPLAALLSMFKPGLAPDLLGPFQPGAYLSAYVVIALCNAFVAAALSFSMAALSRRAGAGYLVAVLLFLTAFVVRLLVAGEFDHWELAKIIDPLGLTVISEIERTTTPLQKNVINVGLYLPLLLNRAVWLAVALGVFALTLFRFRFAHPGTRAHRKIIPGGRSDVKDPVEPRCLPISVPRVTRTFGAGVRIRQIIAITMQSFREIAMSWGGLILGGAITLLILFGSESIQHLGVPLLPKTQRMIEFVGAVDEMIWLIVPLLTVYFVGELIWRDRETGLSEIADAAPAPESILFTGKFLGLALVLIAYQALLMVACMLIQAQLGYYNFEIGLYARVLFGLLLPEHLLFAAMAFAAHTLVNQKYAGYMVALAVYAGAAFAPMLGVEHKLLIFGAAPNWMYSDLSGFGSSVEPWLWFKLYWGAWASLLAVATRLFWVRGAELGIASRLRSARRRLTRPTLGVAAAAAVLITAFGGFIFYNTNVLNVYTSAFEMAARRAEYERRYGQYEGIPQPRIVGAKLRVEIYPERREAEIRGGYRLMNKSDVAIGAIHLAPGSGVETGPAEFDRPVKLALDDQRLDHRIYQLETPLLPGDSLELNFEVRFKPRGFTNDGTDPAVAANGSYFEGQKWLPAMGYQPSRAIAGAGERSAYGLPPRPAVRSLDDVEARRDLTHTERVAFEAIVGTAEGQVAVAPGALRRTWTENGRRYFHYATDAPIRKDFPFFSAAYATREARWNDTAIQIFHHPDHTANLDRMIKSIHASLDSFTKRFGPYPHGQIRFVERPGSSVSLHASPMNISYQEGAALINPDADPRGFDLAFAVMAHETAHQWWGGQVASANVEGGPLLSESLAWYSALSVVREIHGDEHLRRLLNMMREAYLNPSSRADPPLLRARDWFSAYRKGPFAMYALSEYVGAERVDATLRRLIEKYGSGEPPLPTSLDLYAELQAVTPDSLRPLLADLFEANTFWELSTKEVKAEQAETGEWQVTIHAQARKVTVDVHGVVTEVPMDDLVEVGVFAAAESGGLGEHLYMGMHRIRSGDQRITVTVSRKPARAGIDPRNLLIDVKTSDNLKEITSAKALPEGSE